LVFYGTRVIRDGTKARDGNSQPGRPRYGWLAAGRKETAE
jgi:hypothetical protein